MGHVLLKTGAALIVSAAFGSEYRFVRRVPADKHAIVIGRVLIKQARLQKTVDHL